MAKLKTQNLEDSAVALAKVHSNLFGVDRANRAIQLGTRLQKASSKSSNDPVIRNSFIAHGMQTGNIEHKQQTLKTADKNFGIALQDLKRQDAKSRGNVSRFRTLQFKAEGTKAFRFETKANNAGRDAVESTARIGLLREVRDRIRVEQIKNDQFLRQQGVTRKILAP